jgi:hypothetical protein
MWTLYVGDELMDLVSDLELAGIMHEAESGQHARFNVVIDLLREVAVIS